MRTGWIAVDPALGRMARDDEVCLDESTPRRRQTSKDCDRRGERWIRHDVEWTAGQAHVGDVDMNDLDRVVRETGAQLVDPLRVQLEREHRRTGSNERSGECAGSRP